MKRLIRKAEDQYQEQQPEANDNYLGQYVEIVYNKSKWLGYTGMVDEKLRGEKYLIYLDPKNYEDPNEFHRVYITKYEASKWLNIIQDAQPE